MVSRTPKHKNVRSVYNNFNLPHKRRLSIQCVYYQPHGGSWSSEKEKQAQYTRCYDLPLYCEKFVTTPNKKSSYMETYLKRFWKRPQRTRSTPLLKYYYLKDAQTYSISSLSLLRECTIHKDESL